MASFLCSCSCISPTLLLILLDGSSALRQDPRRRRRLRRVDTWSHRSRGLRHRTPRGARLPPFALAEEPVPVGRQGTSLWGVTSFTSQPARSFGAGEGVFLQKKPPTDRSKSAHRYERKHVCAGEFPNSGRAAKENLSGKTIRLRCDTDPSSFFSVEQRFRTAECTDQSILWGKRWLAARGT